MSKVVIISETGQHLLPHVKNIEASLIVKQIKKSLKLDEEVVVIDDTVRKKLVHKGVTYRNLTDYNKGINISKIEKYAVEMARGWHNDSIEYRDISLGAMVECHFYFFLIDVFKNIELAYNILKSESPDKIIIFEGCQKIPDSIMVKGNENFLGKAMEMVAKSKNISCDKIKNSTICIFEQHLVNETKKYVELYLNKMKALRRCKLPRTHDNKNCILIEADSRFTADVIPVIENLRINSSNKVLTLATDLLSQKLLQNENLCYNLYDDYLAKENVKTQSIVSSDYFKCKFIYGHANIFELVKPRIDFILSKHSYVMQKYIDTSYGIVKKENVKVIVVSQDSLEREKILCTVGNKMGVQTLVMQHGVLSFLTNNELLETPTSHNVAIWGDVNKEIFYKLGVSSERLHITGASRLDKIACGTVKHDKHELCGKLKLNPKKRIITLITQPLWGLNSLINADANENVFRSVVNTIMDYPDLQLIVKPHPGENPTLYHNLSKEYGNVDIRVAGGNAIINYFNSQEIDLHSLLNASDIIILSNSTVGLEAMILKEPVISVNFTGYPDLIPYAESGAAIGVYNEEGLKSAIKEILHNSETVSKLMLNMEVFIYKYAYLQDGKASKRVAKLIEELIKY